MYRAPLRYEAQSTRLSAGSAQGHFVSFVALRFFDGFLLLSSFPFCSLSIMLWNMELGAKLRGFTRPL